VSFRGGFDLGGGKPGPLEGKNFPKKAEKKKEGVPFIVLSTKYVGSVLKGLSGKEWVWRRIALRLGDDLVRRQGKAFPEGKESHGLETLRTNAGADHPWEIWAIPSTALRFGLCEGIVGGGAALHNSKSMLVGGGESLHES